MDEGGVVDRGRARLEKKLCLSPPKWVYIFFLRKAEFLIPVIVCSATRAVGRTMNFPAEYEMHLVEAIQRIGLERIRQTIE
jgi:hypothetical protein